MDAISVLNRILETYLHAFEAERGEVLSKADKNLMKLMKHAFDAGAYTMLQAVSTAYRTQATIPEKAPASGFIFKARTY
jgi:hypothetical protein